MARRACKKHIYIVVSQTGIILTMKPPKLTKLELQIMEVLWSHGPCAIREIQEAFPKRGRPAYSTVQTTVYRLEGKRTLRRIKKISHAHIFEASISRGQAQGRLIDDLLSLLGDRLQPIMAHLIESRKFTLQDVRDAERALLALQERDEEEKE
jgi:predicted transcriptional regulator